MDEKEKMEQPAEQAQPEKPDPRSESFVTAANAHGGEYNPAAAGCVKQLTGWTLDTAEAKRMLRQAARIQEIADRVATILTEFPTLTETQVTDVAIHDHNWRTNNWRRHAANLTR